MTSPLALGGAIDALEQRLSEAKQRIRQLETELAAAHSRSEHATHNALADGETIAALREALEFYADLKSYCAPSLHQNEPVRNDGGLMARAALARCQPEQEGTP